MESYRLKRIAESYQIEEVLSDGGFKKVFDRATSRKNTWYYWGVGSWSYSYEENQSAPEAQSAPSEEESTPAPTPQNFYTIQLASFQNVESAREEAKKLMDQGYQALVLRSSKYYSVCVDKFENAAQAAERLIQLKDAFGGKVYQDTFVRFVRQKQAVEE